MRHLNLQIEHAIRYWVLMEERRQNILLKRNTLKLNYFNFEETNQESQAEVKTAPAQL